MMDMMVLIVGVMTAAGELTYPIVDTNQLGFYGTSGGAITQSQTRRVDQPPSVR